MAGLEQLCQFYESSATSTYDARKLSERDRDYVDSKQLTAEEISTLKKRKQPPVILNRLKPKLNYLLGSERQQRTDPKAFPRNPDDEAASEAATDAIRYVCDKNDFPIIRSRAFENMIVEGFGAAIVEASQGAKNIDIKIRQIHWDRVFYDPYSRESDFSDAKYTGIVAWMDEDEGIALYGDKFKDVVNVAFQNAASGDQTYDDKPYLNWVDGKRKRVRVCEIYFREGGKWMCATYTRGGYLRDEQPSPYLDEDKTPENPMVLQSCYVDRDNNRYGEIRALISPQDEINKRRSKALHLLNSRQTMGERGAVDDIAKMKAESAKPDGHIEYNPGMKFEFVPTNDLAMGNLQLLQEAKNEVDSIGNNAALQGKQGAQSGRELIARQQAGQVENGPIFDNLRHFNKAVYRKAWARIKQFWDGPMWVRVTDDEKKLKYVGLNQPITAGEQMIEDAKKQGMPPDQLAQMVEALANDPRAQQVVGTRNDVSEMDMDIIVEDVPDTVNIQGEQFEQLVNVYSANPNGGITQEDLITASSIRNKDKILERMRSGQQGMAQAGQAKADAELNKTNSETEKNLATAMNQRAQAVSKVSDAAVNAVAPMPGSGQMQQQELAAADSGAMRMQ